MEYICFLFVIVGILLFQFWKNDRRRKQLLTEDLLAQWGQVPEREYEDGDLRKIASFYHMRLEADPQRLHLDDITWNDLGMDQIYMLLNHTQSSVGEEALYRMLRMPETDRETLQERDRLARVFDQDSQLRLSLEKSLHTIGKGRRLAMCQYISLLSGQQPQSNLRHYLGLMALLVSAIMMVLSPERGLVLLLAVCGYQMFSYYQQKAQVEDLFNCIANVVRLQCCAKEISDMACGDEIAFYQEKLQKLVTQLEPICKKARSITAGKAMGGSPLDLLADYVKMILHVDLIAYHQIIDLVRQKEDEIWQLMETLGQLECGLAIASFRRCLGQWCEPELRIAETGDVLSVYGEGLYHPLIDHAVPNSIQADRCQLITGSNASGKSTFLKTVALSAVLAQTIYTVPGQKYQAPFYQIYSSMALKDNLVDGESYYMVEIRSLKRILDRGHDRLPVLCFVDEVLRGTNTVERIAASTQILKSMSQMNILCFAATHDGELTYLLEDHFDNGHFSETIAEGDIYFSYRLQPGRAIGRNALQLLGLMGYDEDVLAQAREMAERFDRTGTWSRYNEG